MREQYPFFREEDEHTQAVIGEDAAEADLNGEYQKPYAILTQKRLYCKNEQGNFITPSKNLLGAAMEQMGKGKVYLLWFAFALVVFDIPYIGYFAFFEGSKITISIIIRLVLDGIFIICFLLFAKKLPINASRLFCIITLPRVIFFSPWADFIADLYWLNYGFNSFLFQIVAFHVPDLILRVLPVILILAYYIPVRILGHSFVIRHDTGRFSFAPSLYSAAELKHFAAQVKALKAGDTNGQ